MKVKTILELIMAVLSAVIPFLVKENATEND